jgi:hypothetical protein
MKLWHRGYLGISILLLVVAIYFAVSSYRYLARYERATGVVTALNAENDRCYRGRQCTRFRADVDFTDGGAQKSTVLAVGNPHGHDQPASKADYQVGDSVPMVFDPDRPDEAEVYDFWSLWWIPLALLVPALATMYAAFHHREEEEVVSMHLDQPAED